MQMKRSISHLAHWTLIGVLMLSFLAAAVPQPVLAASPNAVCDKTHVVQGGETIYKIAKTYSISVNRLAVTNNIEKPYTLTVGQSLCIPGRATGAALAVWTATYSNNKVTITGSSFKKEYLFIVRVRENDTTAYYKLGQVKTSKAGELKESISVPKELQQATALNICLKDAFTDVLVCKRAFRL
jgi:LysM repeat protein